MGAGRVHTTAGPILVLVAQAKSRMTIFVNRNARPIGARDRGGRYLATGAAVLGGVNDDHRGVPVWHLRIGDANCRRVVAGEQTADVAVTTEGRIEVSLGHGPRSGRAVSAGRRVVRSGVG